MNIYDKWIIKQFIAHRGLHNEIYPENSTGAFMNAVEKGYAIELDVHDIDDGTLVVFHDNKLARMTDVDGYVCNLTADKLKGIRLNKTDYRIPSFSETLEAVNGKTPILIEIKNDNKVGVLEKKLLDALKEYKGEYAVQSFNPYSIDYFRINAPEILRGQLSCFFKGEKLAFYKKYILKRMLLNKTTKPDFISYEITDLPNRYVRRNAGTPVLGWTARSEEEYEYAKKYCNNIIFENFLPKPF